MAEAIRWWLCLEILGLAALPLSGIIFRCLPDRGYSLSKAVGWFVAAWVAWVAASTSVLPFGAATARLTVSAMALASIALLALHRGRYTRAWMVYFRERIGYILAVESLFAAAFFGFVVLRSYSPEIIDTEKPMEYMYLQASLSAHRMPPADLWLSGHTVNYYYFGFFAQAYLALLSSVAAPIAFNLALAGTFAVTLLCLVGTGYNAAAACNFRQAGRVMAAALAPVLVLLLGNPEGIRQSWTAMREGRDGDFFGLFFGATRVIDDRAPGDTINEFPAYSYLLGDLHPHVLAMPLFTLGLASSLALVLYLDRPRRQNLTGAAATGALIGWLYMTNSWDVPVIAVIAAGGVLLVGSYYNLTTRARATVPVLSVLAVMAALACLPFLINFEAPVDRNAQIPPWVADIPVLRTLGRYVGPVWWERTDAREFLRMWGIQFAMTLLVLLAYGRRIVVRKLLIVLILAVPALVAVVVLDAPVLLLVPLILFCVLLGIGEGSPVVRWAFLLAAAGWGLVLVPELVYLRDVFENRMNTVFKFYYQAWQILGVALAVLLTASLPRLSISFRGHRTAALSVVFVLCLLLVSLIPTVGGVRARAEGGMDGLDGTAFLRTRDAEAYAAAAWLRRNTAASDVVLEATGAAYSLYARLATYAGRPTVLGWANHERQWHAGQPELLAEIARREADVRRLYGLMPSAEQQELFRRYDIKYVYYGQMERQLQSELGKAQRDPFADVLEAVWRDGDSVLYQTFTRRQPTTSHNPSAQSVTRIAQQHLRFLFGPASFGSWFLWHVPACQRTELGVVGIPRRHRPAASWHLVW